VPARLPDNPSLPVRYLYSMLFFYHYNFFPLFKPPRDSRTRSASPQRRNPLAADLAARPCEWIMGPGRRGRPCVGDMFHVKHGLAIRPLPTTDNGSIVPNPPGRCLLAKSLP